jgi:flagellar FliL protein
VTASVTDTAVASEAAPPAGKSPLMRNLPVVGALVLGVLVGTFVVVPRLRPSSAPAKAEVKHASTEPPRMVKVENIIVNPAGTAGQHFLIVSLAIQVPTAEAETRLRQSDAPMRDAVTGVLERLTLDQLTQPGAREKLRRDVKAAAARFAGDTGIQVFVPQFLIQ